MGEGSPASIEVREACTPSELALAAQLVRAYADSVGPSGCFTGLEQELASLGECYSPPHGGIWLAWVGTQPAGCCAFKPCPDTDHANACEMKRLYVAPDYRGLGVGHWLVDAVLQAARLSGYSCVLLDTLHEMEAARSLYEEMGFVEIPPYLHTPIAGAHHLKVVL